MEQLPFTVKDCYNTASRPQWWLGDVHWKESYTFAAQEFEAFAQIMETRCHPLTSEQLTQLRSLVDFYREKAIVQ